ncbi:hypothetical protein F511_34925 [Dorcoceras hygrometricum]|uniref:Uncharacterized protein n=1 Tax=Dorcoceras hygrometricum TaxID=472368 RepID=A0A2Z7C2H2_9LAMI|nr:hypothetical protein F511_34925 [Dorcoceras hygrometricum]
MQLSEIQPKKNPALTKSTQMWEGQQSTQIWDGQLSFNWSTQLWTVNSDLVKSTQLTNFTVALVSSVQLMVVESVARAIDRYDDVGVTYSLLLVVVCVAMVAADQQTRKYKSVEKRRRLN